MHRSANEPKQAGLLTVHPDDSLSVSDEFVVMHKSDFSAQGSDVSFAFAVRSGVVVSMFIQSQYDTGAETFAWITPSMVLAREVSLASSDK